MTRTDENKGCAVFCQYLEKARFSFSNPALSRAFIVDTGNGPLAGGPGMVQVRFLLEGQVGPERRGLARDQQGDMFLV